MPMLDRLGLLLKDGYASFSSGSKYLLTFDRISKTPTVALLVQHKADSSIEVLNLRCPLKMMTAFCPFLEVVDTDYGKSIILSGATIEAFRYTCLWMDACCAARRKVEFTLPQDNLYIRCARLREATIVLQLNDEATKLEREMKNFERGQVHSDIIKRVYAISPPCYQLRDRVAKSIATAYWEKRIKVKTMVWQIREEIPEFNADMNKVMDEFYKESAARKERRAQAIR